MTLNTKQQRFVEEFLTDMNACKAAERAGYAYASGTMLTRNPKIQAAINSQVGEQSAQLDISKEQVLKEIARVAFSDPRRLFDNNGAILPVHDWPDDAAAAISSIKVVEIKDSEGIITGQIKHINFWDKGKHLYLIAKHLGLLNDRLEITTSVSHLIRAGRERIRMADQHEATTDLTSRVPPDSDTP
jgi:phage terminase small subunit